MIRRPRIRRAGAATIAAAAILGIGGVFALTLIPLDAPRAVLHGGTEGYVVEATVPTMTGCDPLEIRVSARADAPALTELAVTAAMPTLGHLAGEVAVVDPGGTTRVEGLCLSMPGPWEVTLHLRSGTEDEWLLIPLEITG